MKQRTLKQSTQMVGIGLHSGKDVTLTLVPQPSDHGIIFERVDLPTRPRLVANAFLIQDTQMSSNLSQDGVRVGTIEHLLSALSAFGIDNLLIQVSAAEIPISDGSAYPFIQMIQNAGIQIQNAPKKFLKITQPVRVQDGDKWAEFLPYDGYQLNFDINFNHPAIPQAQSHAQLDFSTQNFIEQIAPARTFGFLKDIEFLRQNNLALGGNLDNAIVLDEATILNPEGLRFGNELARHKLLDAVGDLSLIGHTPIAQFNAYKSGHALNNALIRAVLTNPESHKIVTFDDEKTCPIDFQTP